MEPRSRESAKLTVIDGSAERVATDIVDSAFHVSFIKNGLVRIINDRYEVR